MLSSASGRNCAWLKEGTTTLIRGNEGEVAIRSFRRETVARSGLRLRLGGEDRGCCREGSRAIDELGVPLEVGRRIRYERRRSPIPWWRPSHADGDFRVSQRTAARGH